MAFWRRAAKPPPAPDVYGLADRFWRPLEPLGPSRQQVISCLRGDLSPGPYGWHPAGDDNLFDYFRRFVALHRAAAPPGLDPYNRSIHAAGLLLSGDLAGADEIIDLLPPEPHLTEHGAGKCKLMPARVLKGVLPFPGDVGNPDGWTAGSPEQAALRSWLALHRARLAWAEPEGRYHLNP